MSRTILMLVLSLLMAACGPRQLEPDTPSVCDLCDDWNSPQQPFRIYGNTWYVGTAGLTALLVEAGDELILIDGALPQSAEIIDANIRSLGFEPLKISAIFVSHAHFDHAGGVAALQRLSGAAVYSSTEGAKTLASGELQADDPQFLETAESAFAPIKNVKAVHDGAVVSIDGVDITAVYSPGHTPGGTSWTWESCALDTCYRIVYADSLTAVSAAGYKYSDGRAANQLVESADVISLLDCDILLSPHPFFFGMQDKLQRRDEGNPFVNNVACAIYAETMLGWLQRRLHAEGG